MCGSSWYGMHETISRGRHDARLAALDALCKAAHAQLVAEDAERVRDNQRFRASANLRDPDASNPATTR